MHRPLPTRSFFRRSTLRSRLRTAMTLAELAVVASILAALGALLVPLCTDMLQRGKLTATQETLGQIRVAVLDQYYVDRGGRLPTPLDPTRVFHPQLAYLFVNPATFAAAAPAAGFPTTDFDAIARIGWKGPYLRSGAAGGMYLQDTTRGFGALYGVNGDPAPLDGWGNPIVLQQPAAASPAAVAGDLSYARLVSAGPNGVIETPPGVVVPVLVDRGDDVLLPLGGGLQ